MRKILGLATPALIILSGILIVKYREEMVTWLTVGLGAIFFISGIISCVSYYIQRKHVLKMRAEGITLFDSEGNPVGQSMPTFPIVGVGSLILGVILASMPETFLNWLTYIFAAIILLVSVYQIADLIVANRYGRVGWAYWVMPIIMLLAAVVALVNPESISSSPLFFLGWAMIISGGVMIVNVLKIYTVRRAAEKRAADLAKKAESAVEVEVKEETDLIVKE
jgi:uncharacterized membrane protein HdeD (DUF308 family)